jgi:predicted transcriptional regulator
MVRITTRLTDSLAGRLAELAAAAGVDRSTMVRRLIEAADGRGSPAASTEPPSHDELIGLLSEKARAGSGPAIRQLLSIERQEAAQAAVDRMNAIAMGR